MTRRDFFRWKWHCFTHSVREVYRRLTGDPFDRMLAAQSQIEDVALVTNDPAFERFDVRRYW